MKKNEDRVLIMCHQGLSRVGLVIIKLSTVRNGSPATIINLDQAAACGHVLNPLSLHRNPHRQSSALHDTTQWIPVGICWSVWAQGSDKAGDEIRFRGLRQERGRGNRAKPRGKEIFSAESLCVYTPGWHNLHTPGPTTGWSVFSPQAGASLVLHK